MQGEQEKPAGGAALPEKGAEGGADAGATSAGSGSGSSGTTAGRNRTASPAPSIADQLTAACRDIIAPLVRADGGHLYLLSVTRDEVHVHLTGTCAGCPGASATRDKMIQPVISAVAPNVQVRLTTGWTVPDGAKELE